MGIRSSSINFYRNSYRFANRPTIGGAAYNMKVQAAKRSQAAAQLPFSRAPVSGFGKSAQASNPVASALIVAPSRDIVLYSGSKKGSGQQNSENNTTSKVMGALFLYAVCKYEYEMKKGYFEGVLSEKETPVTAPQAPVVETPEVTPSDDTLVSVVAPEQDASTLSAEPALVETPPQTLVDEPVDTQPEETALVVEEAVISEPAEGGIVVVREELTPVENIEKEAVLPETTEEPSVSPSFTPASATSPKGPGSLDVFVAVLLLSALVLYCVAKDRK